MLSVCVGEHWSCGLELIREFLVALSSSLWGRGVSTKTLNVFRWGMISSLFLPTSQPPLQSLS